MDVFLIPLGGDRYELYCEAPVEEPESDVEPPKSGLIARLKHQFSTVLATAEQARHRRASQPPEEYEEPTGVIGRMKARALAWLADRIAEQEKVSPVTVRTLGVHQRVDHTREAVVVGRSV